MFIHPLGCSLSSRLAPATSVTSSASPPRPPLRCTTCLRRGARPLPGPADLRGARRRLLPVLPRPRRARLPGPPGKPHDAAPAQRVPGRLYFDSLVYTGTSCPLVTSPARARPARHRLPLRHGRHGPRRPHRRIGLPPPDRDAIARGTAARLLRLTDDTEPMTFLSALTSLTQLAKTGRRYGRSSGSRTAKDGARSSRRLDQWQVIPRFRTCGWNSCRSRCPMWTGRRRSTSRLASGICTTLRSRTRCASCSSPRRGRVAPSSSARGWARSPTWPPVRSRASILVVADMAASRAALAARGVGVSDVQDMGGVLYSYFSDPDGNLWTLSSGPPATSPSQIIYFSCPSVRFMAHPRIRSQGGASIPGNARLTTVWTGSDCRANGGIMSGRYVGYVAGHDPLHGFLSRIVRDLLGVREPRPAFRVFRLSGSNVVYKYEEKFSRSRSSASSTAPDTEQTRIRRPGWHAGSTRDSRRCAGTT